MKNSFKKFPMYIKIGGPLLIVVILYFVFFSGGSEVVVDTITIAPREFVQKLSVTGNVEASQTADLGFAQSGRIDRVMVKVGDSVKKGDVLANIENGDLQANLLQKRAVLAREKSNLSTKQIGTRPEQLAITQQKYLDSVSSYVSALHSSYLKIEQAFVANADVVFTNGSSVAPSLQLLTDSLSQQQAIERKRIQITESINKWKNLITILDSSVGEYKKADLDNVQNIADSTMNLSKSLINDLSKITANLSTTQGYTQTTVNSYRNSISNAGDLIAAAASELNTTKTAMNTAENSYLLDKSGSTANDLSAQNAVVAAAEADVLNAQAQLSKSIIAAPFDGVITRMEARVGEIASANTSNISINSLDTFIIKSNVPEVYISNLSVGDSASTTLDAYGSSVSFPLVVTAIDPAQTVVNGVSNYKTTLQFVDKDNRIKPGMTANIDITTKNIPNSFIVPLGSIKNRDGKKYVQIRQGGEVIEREITTGAVSTVGEVQVLSGLNVNDQVILNPKTL